MRAVEWLSGRVHPRRGTAVGFDARLTRYSEERLCAEKFPPKVLRFVARQIDEVKRTYPEQLAGNLTVACRDDRCIDPMKVARKEEIVDGVGIPLAYPGHRLRCSCAAADERPAEVPKRVLRGRDRVGLRLFDCPDHVNLI